jgi:hypothetical protein
MAEISEHLRDMIQDVADEAIEEYGLDEDQAIDLVINIEKLILSEAKS